MNNHRHRIAWWLLTGTFVAGLTTFPFGSLLDATSVVLPAFAAYGLVGALVAARRSANVIGWVFLSIGALTGLLGIAALAVDSASSHPGQVAWWGVLGAWYYVWFWFPLIFLATTFTVLNYPDGLPSIRWRVVQWLAAFSVGMMTLIAALSPTLPLSLTAPEPTVGNPFAPTLLGAWNPVGSVPFAAAALVAVACGLAAGVSVVIRARRATGVERLQLRWFAFAVALFVPCLLASSSSLLGELIFAVGLALVPISCGIAILRFHLYDIDRIISRTASYALVTGVLLVVYVAVVAGVSGLFSEADSLAVAAATLAAAAVFRPVLSRVQLVVDRRFNRSRYDAQRTVDAFAVRLRDEVDPELVGTDLLRVLDQTVEPTSASLWLVGSP